MRSQALCSPAKVARRILLSHELYNATGGAPLTSHPPSTGDNGGRHIGLVQSRSRAGETFVAPQCDPKPSVVRQKCRLARRTPRWPQRKLEAGRSRRRRAPGVWNTSGQPSAKPAHTTSVWPMCPPRRAQEHNERLRCRWTEKQDGQGSAGSRWKRCLCTSTA